MNRVPYVRVLHDSLIASNPGARLSALLLDDAARSITSERFVVVRPSDLDLGRDEFVRMATIYDAFELSCAMKPHIVSHCLRESGADAILYLDSDIEVFASLDHLVSLAAEHALLLTPHLTAPPPRPPVSDQEEGRLWGGAFNAGFVAVGSRATDFLDWWRERLARDCIVDGEHGYFVDQRWLDLAPGYFEHHILRDPGCNVATWNLLTRTVRIENGRYVVDGAPLRFFHYSGFDPRRPWLLASWFGAQPPILLSEEPALASLTTRYASRLRDHGFDDFSGQRYGFASTSSGLKLTPVMRRLYRKALIVSERHGSVAPPSPFSADDEPFVEWLNEPEGSSEEDGMSRFLAAFRNTDSDLRTRFASDPPGTRDFLNWVRSDGFSAGLIPSRLARPATASRTNAKPPAKAVAAVEPGLLIIAPAESTHPLSELGALVADALSEIGVPFAVTRWNGAGESEQFAPIHPESSPFKTLLVLVPTNQIPALAYHLSHDLFESRFVIGSWFDENDNLADVARLLELLDEVWVPSEFSRAWVTAAADVPVYVLALPYERDVRQPSQGDVAASAGLALVDFDHAVAPESAQRHNVEGIIEAFSSAASGYPDKRFVVYIENGEHVVSELERLRYLAAQAGVELKHGSLSPEERRELIGACNCFLALEHRREFPYQLAEAMAAAKPVIAPAFGGNADYVSPSVAYVVPHRLTNDPQTSLDPLHNRPSAEPDVEAASRLVLTVMEQPVEAAEVGRRAKASVARVRHEDLCGFLRSRVAGTRYQTVEHADKEDDVMSSDEDADEADQTSSLQLAAFTVTAGPLSRLGSPSRFGAPGRIARRLLFRLMRPYIAYQSDVDSAMLAALLNVNHAVVTGSEGRSQLPPVTQARGGVALQELTRLADRLDGLERTFLALSAPAPVGNADPNSLPPELVAFHRQIVRPGMTSAEERAFCHYYAREIYSGQGQIVDLGSWLGSLTIALAMGLSENGRQRTCDKRVHAFDTFEWATWMDNHEAVIGTRLEGSYSAGESFRSEFESLISAWRDRIEVYEGDLLRVGWDRGPIEFLVVDAMKSWELANAILVNFMTHLVPGESLVFHQDFGHYAQTWIHLIGYRLREFFEPVQVLERSDTVVFRSTQSLPRLIPGYPFSLESFSRDEIDEAFEYSLSIATERMRFDVAASKVHALTCLGDLVGAERELERWLTRDVPAGTDLPTVAAVLESMNGAGARDGTVAEMTEADYIFGMTSQQEQAYLRDYARSQFTCSGALIDLGCWLGSSTIALAQGLEERSAKALVHAYDQFVWQDWMNVMDQSMQRSYVDGESFLAEFQERTAPWKRWIDVHVADLTKTEWHGGPIEFLFIDAMKNWELTRSIAIGFFSSLQPGSLVMHQDFVLSGCPWIHLLMFRLRGQFEPVEHIEPWSYVFRTVETPTVEILQVAANPTADLGEIDVAFEWARSLVSDRWQLPIVAAKIELLCSQGEIEHARSEAAEWFVGPALDDPEVKSVVSRYPELR